MKAKFLEHQKRLTAFIRHTLTNQNTMDRSGHYATSLNITCACGPEGAIKEQQDWADGCFWRGFCPRWGVPGFDRSVGPCKARLGLQGSLSFPGGWMEPMGVGPARSGLVSKTEAECCWSNICCPGNTGSLKEGWNKDKKRGEVNMRVPYCHISADLMWHLYFCLHLGCLTAYSRCWG